MSADQLVDIKILDRTYPVKCADHEVMQLQEAANYLNDQMLKLRQSSTTLNTERLAIVAALNICHEFMLLKHKKDTAVDSMNDQVKSLQQRIQKFLGTKEGVVA